MANSHAGHWWWVWAIVITLLLHYGWEMGQARFFTNFRWKSTVEHAWPCFKASLGDLGIAAASYALAALVFRRFAWPIRQDWLWPTTLWVASGLVITIVIERGALSIGRWSYAPAMPTIGGIGLAPLLQWLVVPVVTLALVRSLVRHSALQGGSP